LLFFFSFNLIKMRFAIAALATVAAFAFGADASQFNSALFSAEVPSENLLQDMFTAFMKQYNKAYTHSEFFTRYNQFKSNVEIIRVHNAFSNASYTLGVNEFADLSFSEFKSKYFGYKPSTRAHGSGELHEITEAAPTAVDWRTKNVVTAVKNQGQCGSCWAFSATGSIEGAWALAGNTLTSISEQQIVDCDTKGSDEGCNGGWMDGAFEYVISNKGLCTETAYPYTGVQAKTCKSCTPVVTISGYKDVASMSEKTGLLNAVGTVGPVSIAVEADQAAWQLYSSGIVSKACGTTLDHGVLIVGYDISRSTAANQYWIVKNSWGASWGEKGYIRLLYGNDECGLAKQPSYPTV